MEDSEKVAIIQEHAKTLRAEVQRNAESQRKLFQWVILGIAGAVALRKDVAVSDLQAFLPFMPILAMIIIAFWLAETSFSFRCGRWLSLAEERINELASGELVGYEQELLRWRRRVFNHNWIYYVLGYLGLSIAYYTLVAYLMSVSELRRHAGFTVLVYTLAVISNLSALVQLFRVRYELRGDNEKSPSKAAAAPNPAAPADG